jgi:hypothetical protein
MGSRTEKRKRESGREKGNWLPSREVGERKRESSCCRAKKRRKKGGLVGEKKREEDGRVRREGGLASEYLWRLELQE